MASGKFLRIARDVARRDRPVFDILMDFERTKQIRTKTRLNFTIDKALASRFRKLCREKGYAMSSKIEHAIKEILEKESKSS